MDTEFKTFGDYVRETAKRKKRSFREVARRAGLSAPTLSDIVSGKTKQPKSDTLLKLAVGLSERPEQVLAAYSGKSLSENGVEVRSALSKRLIEAAHSFDRMPAKKRSKAELQAEPLIDALERVTSDQ